MPKPTQEDLEQLKELLQSCLNANRDALLRFQEQFGEDIYNFPLKVKRMAEDLAGDFYCFCFENRRIFKRLLIFQGICSLRTYQYRILNDLFNEWYREGKKLELPTEPLDDEENIQSPDQPIPSSQSENLKSLLTSPTRKTIYIKLLSFHEFGLAPADIRLIADISGRSIEKTMDILIEMESKLAVRDEEYGRRLDRLDILEGRILELERKIYRRKAELGGNALGHDPEYLELNKKLLWRRNQKEKLLADTKKVQCRLTYRDIAHLLNVSLGQVSEKINEMKKMAWEEFQGFSPNE